MQQPRHRPRPRRLLLAAAAAVAALAVLLVAGGGWYFSGEIRAGGLRVRAPDTDATLRVLAVTAEQVTLTETGEPEPALRQGFTYGLVWDTGFGQLTGPARVDGDQVTRRLVVLTGAHPVPGQGARLERDAFPPEPGAAVDTPVRQVVVPGRLGPLPAWLAEGSGTTWAVLVHGQGADRAEALRPLRATTALGLPSLVVSYRNDRGVEPDPSGHYGFGRTEWADLEAAVRYASGAGAERVVLVGQSMGGAIVASFLRYSPLADLVAAVVLEAPMLDLEATIDHRAARRGLPVLGLPVPAPVTWTAKRLASVRYDLDLGRVDYLDDPDWLVVPALLVHGEDDANVPVETSRRLAEVRRDFVRLRVVPAADHLEAWNVDPAAYERLVRDFVSTAAPVPHAAGLGAAG